MKYIYEAIIEPSGNWLEVRFPDFGIITQGEDMQDAAYMAQDLLENHIVMALRKGRSLPAPTFGNDCSDAGYRMGIVVDCDESTPQVDTMTVNEAADILDVSPTRIRAMISSGILKSQKVGMVHMVDAQSVMNRFNEPARAGRPKREAALA
ncbi:type II toxin-antitoxin system HicB family antitoxin [Berryella intestinalis]|uniref:type II toxin-antitoxin system HicB family antitoxin n=1 Tax=Berryella intestinalis TaxID=1531429 RepID=UPI00068A9E3C|nr:type II toxin-antitoxin system HicB family antitoxin [Berryella intestinalis]